MLSIAWGGAGALQNGGRDLGIVSVSSWKPRKFVCAVSTKQKVHNYLQTTVSVSSINVLVDM